MLEVTAQRLILQLYRPQLLENWIWILFHLLKVFSELVINSTVYRCDALAFSVYHNLQHLVCRLLVVTVSLEHKKYRWQVMLDVELHLVKAGLLFKSGSTELNLIDLNLFVGPRNALSWKCNMLRLESIQFVLSLVVLLLKVACKLHLRSRPSHNHLVEIDKCLP